MNKQAMTGEKYTAAKLIIDWEIKNTNRNILIMYAARIAQVL